MAEFLDEVTSPAGQKSVSSASASIIVSNSSIPRLRVFSPRLCGIDTKATARAAATHEFAVVRHQQPIRLPDGTL